MKGKVFIVGLGLIGGSLGLCIKDKHPEATIIGYDLNVNEQRLAQTRGIIDEMTDSFQLAAESADLIILSTPVFQTEKLLKELSTYQLKRNVIITDTGSTKEQIMNTASILNNKGISFIGGHPMAGSHKSGVSAAKKILFENAFYLLTPFEGTTTAVKEELCNWLQGTSAKFVVVNPREHDELTGVVSHFPHVIAASLVHQAKFSNEKNPVLSRLAAGGFRDITRIASSNPVMWKDITIHNREVLLNLMEQWKEEMNVIQQMIYSGNEEEIQHYFQEAKSFRDDLPAKDKGAIPSFYDLYIDVPDYPGVISEVTGYLAEERISLTNIRILETREDVYGVMVLSFQTDGDRERARTCLDHNTGYEMFLA
ncbi:prephenate dehydrogenase [Rossellomorea sp. BNER]|uniref:prephenate dehydrogenase n=1 Tax=Rossellomorea sp. BNER TaxID=2962031 RepID=UPI003AF1F832|nr:prephenate dehydrogenase [Rossellomorea sp. BNER]